MLASLVVGSLYCTSINAQIINEVTVHINPGTEVHMYESVTNTGAITVGSGGLLYVDGTLVNNSTMTFENSASLLRGSTGSDGTGTGTYIVKRQGSAGQIFNYWSSPMTAFGTVPGNPSYLFNSNNSTLDHGDDQDPDPGWTQYSASMTPGVGYGGMGAGLYSFTGNVNNGNVSVPLIFYPYIPGNTSPGSPFNLCGNPYPSAISCAALVAANTDINGSIYFWDDDLSVGTNYSYTDYAIWNGTGSLGTGAGSTPPNGFISTGQGFVIRALNASATLNFNNVMRVAGPNNQFFRMNSQDSRLWFSLENEDLYNEMLVGLITEATDFEDRIYDALKLKGNADISLSALSENKEYAIIAVPPPSVDKTIPLNVFVSSGGAYQFKANTMEGFENMDVYFTDRRNSSSTLLNQATVIDVILANGDNNDRFYLNFSRANVGVHQTPTRSVSAFTTGDNLFIRATGLNNETSTLSLLDVNGRKVMGSKQIMFSNGEASISMAELSQGIYILKLSTEEAEYTQKILR